MSNQENSDSCNNSETDHNTSSNQTQTVASQDSNQIQTENVVTVSFSITHTGKNNVGIESLLLATFHNTENNGSASGASISHTNENSELNTPLSLILCEPSLDNSTLAKKWNNSFDVDQSEALRSILELILQSSGLRLAFPRELATKIQYLDVEQLNSWKSQFNSRILIKNEAYVTNLSEFLKLALNEKVLTNEEFMEKIRLLINIMMHSEWCSARRTAMVIGSELANQYLQIWIKYENKRKRAPLPSSRTLLKKKLDLVKTILDSFLSLMILFLRDLDLKIRKPMFDLFCNWIDEYPTFFVNDLYLREIFWSLYDSNTNIRASAVDTCSSIITSKEVDDKLDLFIAKVIPALFLRVNDVKATVSIAALKSLSVIHNELDVFHFGRPEKIYRLIFSKSPGVSLAAASFLFKILHEEYRDSTSFVTEVLIFLYESELLFDRDCASDLVKAMFPNARHQLTDWQAWNTILQSDTLDVHLREVACRTLSSVVHFSTQVTSISEDSPINSYILPPGFVTVEITECESPIRKRQNDICKKTKIEMTNFFGKPLIQLWHKYKSYPHSLLHLISIAGQFSNINSMDIKKYCSFLLNLKCNNPEMSHLKMAVLASLCRFMTESHRWRRTAKTVINILCSDLIIKLPEAFVSYSIPLSEEQTLVAEKNLNVLRSTYCLSKYFDLSHTTVADEALAALTRSKIQPQPDIVCNAAYISLHIVQWQLKNILDGKYCEDELATSLQKLQSRIRSLTILMQHFISSTNTPVRRTAFVVLSKLLSVFSIENLDVKYYPMIHISRPPLDVMEWLNFHLVTEVSWDAIPDDEARLHICHQTLRHFCTLLKLGVLDLSYIHSVLPYFRFYQQRQNYNAVIKEAVEKLVKRDTFPAELLKALVFHSKSSQEECIVAVHGLCSVVLKEVKPAEQRGKVVSSIIQLGVCYSLMSKDFSFLLVLCPILNVVSRSESRKLKDDILKVFGNNADNDEFVKRFLDALK